MSVSVSFISVDQIAPAKHPRKLNPTKTKDIAKSVKEFGGLFQAIGVIADGDRYRLVWGNHRLASYMLLGRTEIEARILLPETTPDQELSYSIQENALRTAESFEDTLARVEQYAAYKRCSMEIAAKQNGVSSSYVSKGRSTIKKLSGKARKLARENKVGLSVLYAIAKARSEEAQQKLLAAHLNGSMSRDDIELAVKKGSGKRVPKKTNLNLSIEGINIKLAIPNGVDYEQIKTTLNTLKGRLNTHAKQQIPIHLLPEVMTQEAS